MRQTLGEWLYEHGITTEGFGDSLDAMLKMREARIITACPTCGGTGVTPKPWGDKRDEGRTFSRCPDCADAPTYIVDKAVVEKAASAGMNAYDSYPSWQDVALGVLVAALGDVRVAREVGRLELLPGDDDEQTPVLMPPDPGVMLSGTASIITWDTELAILEDESMPPTHSEGRVEDGSGNRQED